MHDVCLLLVVDDNADVGKTLVSGGKVARDIGNKSRATTQDQVTLLEGAWQCMGLFGVCGRAGQAQCN